MKILQLEQGTQEWHDARRCTITGTKLARVMGTVDAQRGLIAELIAEKGTELSKEFRITAEMERGNAEEDFAVKKFEEQTGMKIDRVGMCVHDKWDWLANSPDGLIKNKKGKYTEAFEAKCPDSKKLILYKIENMIDPEETGLMGARGLKAGAPFMGIPADYKWQVVDYFLVNEDLERLHFAVYDERFIDPTAKLYIVTVERDSEEMQEAIKEATEELKSFREKWIKWEQIVLPSNF